MILIGMLRAFGLTAQRGRRRRAFVAVAIALEGDHRVAG
jgi:hypothetical protein